MNPVRAIGSSIGDVAERAGFTVNLLLRTFGSVLYLPRRLRFMLDAAYAVGVRALFVTAVVALFAGMIVALQTGLELRKFGQTQLIGNVIALSMCREMGPFMTALILAATVGSKIAAEIGTMTVSDEVTALDVMSIDPTNYLVLPRTIAMTIMLPIMTIFADLIGIAGGAMICSQHLGITQYTYWHAVRESLFTVETLFPKDVWVGLFKALVFGATIAIVSCSSGLRASGGALGVGRAVQHAVMISVILIIVLGFVITWFFYYLLG